MADQLADGRRFRVLTMVDIYTRESLAIKAGQSVKGEDIAMVLNQITLQRGAPKVLFCDIGSEFISQAMDLWAYRNGVRIDFLGPGKPTDNAFVESSNGTLRDECLDVHWFMTIVEARQLIEVWRGEYNESRRDRALGEQTPSEFASQFAAQRELTGLQETENSPWHRKPEPLNVWGNSHSRRSSFRGLGHPLGTWIVRVSFPGTVSNKPVLLDSACQLRTSM